MMKIYALLNRFKKIGVCLLMAAVVAALLAGCGLFGKKEPKEEEVDPSVPAEISQDDADQIVEDKIYDTDLKAVFSQMVTADDETWYSYRIVDSKGEDLNEYLAVNAVSGEVAVYDPEEGEIWDYSQFSHYDEEKDEPVSWDGSFALGKTEVSLYPADDNAFEFNIKTSNGDTLTGVANVSEEKNIGLYEDGELSLSFEMRDGSLIISDNGNMSGYAGVYEKKESEE